MNQRIRELVKQSGLDYDELWTKDQLAVDKFAELIVRDCARTAGLMEHLGRKGIGAQILDNYGVEE
jgi:hypothetical protein